VASEHLTRDLRVTRLVGANQADNLQAKKEEKAAEGDERERVGGAARAVSHAGYRFGSHELESVPSGAPLMFHLI
jgi:hypothetical protein